MAEKTGARRRSVGTSRRDRRVNLAYSDEEHQVLAAAAAREGTAPAAWAARVALAAARDGSSSTSSAETDDGVAAALRGLLETRTELRRIGNNLNQVARELNSDRVVTAAQAEAVLARVEAAVRRVDEATLQVMRERKPRP
ncbi:MobC family plasmid mobilization relaxosome protein [Streptomyces albidoflavus]|uniref:MobC family plasmid mobilization relaxosome protein n=1 Tax=unclassified Streptomyces TaxID=2593676 RepID=UPI000690041B|nr:MULTISPECIES: MobC family plasmid mobilization relaxosome protein [unclassified Streptomyces]MCG5121542.1 MobC family plasmid mobilization relaxosome protein [Streptomyces sp. T7(2022)]MCK2145337.1 MobC family plasmid mobilization relaxosome protein [Streptomyces sp. WAC00276]